MITKAQAQELHEIVGAAFSELRDVEDDADAQRLADTLERAREIAALLVADACPDVAEVGAHASPNATEGGAAVAALDPFAVRQEAERIVGMDYVPTDVLRRLILDYGDSDGERPEPPAGDGVVA